MSERGAPGEGAILLVEDDPVDAASVGRACRQARIDRPIWVEANGMEALARLRGEKGEATRAADRPRLILLDLNLPLMSGLELLAELKADPTLRAIPVVVLSTSSRESDVEACFGLGAAGYVVKPLRFQDFVRALETIDRYWTLSESPIGTTPHVPSHRPERHGPGGTSGPGRPA